MNGLPSPHVRQDWAPLGDEKQKKKNSSRNIVSLRVISRLKLSSTPFCSCSRQNTKLDIITRNDKKSSSPTQVIYSNSFNRYSCTLSQVHTIYHRSSEIESSSGFYTHPCFWTYFAVKSGALSWREGIPNAELLLHHVFLLARHASRHLRWKRERCVLPMED